MILKIIMPRLNYPIKKYQKAVEKIASEKDLFVKVVAKKGSVVRFELFEDGCDVPLAFWVVHHSHGDRKKIIWSKEDYRKAATRLNCTLEEFTKRVASS